MFKVQPSLNLKKEIQSLTHIGPKLSSMIFETKPNWMVRDALSHTGNKPGQLYLLKRNTSNNGRGKERKIEREVGMERAITTAKGPAMAH